jgi:hypothetical protein
MENLKKALYHPIIMFMLGFLISTLLWKYPFILALMAVFIGIVFIGLKTDLLKKKGSSKSAIATFLGAKPEQEEKQGKYCSECGSPRKHKGTCSQSKKNKKEEKENE